MLLPLNDYFYNEFYICYLIKWSTQCKKIEMNTLKIKICLTITNKAALMKKITFPLLT